VLRLRHLDVEPTIDRESAGVSGTPVLCTVHGGEKAGISRRVATWLQCYNIATCFSKITEITKPLKLP
jgi:hypothetical protein